MLNQSIDEGQPFAVAILNFPGLRKEHPSLSAAFGYDSPDKLG